MEGTTEESIGRGLCTVTSVSKLNVTLIGGDERLKLCRGRQKMHTDAETQTMAQTLI